MYRKLHGLCLVVPNTTNKIIYNILIYQYNLVARSQCEKRLTENEIYIEFILSRFNIISTNNGFEKIKHKYFI